MKLTRERLEQIRLSADSGYATDDDEWNEICDLADSALSRQPSDMVLVPRELDGEMLFEMWRAINANIGGHDHESLRYVWRRVLAAAGKGEG